MKHSQKRIIGVLITVILGIIGPLVWALFGQGNVAMPPSEKPIVTLLCAIPFIPTLIFYLVWYSKRVNGLNQAGVKAASPTVFMCASIAIAVALFVVGMLLYPEALTYEIITLALNVVGAVLAFVVGKP